MVLKKYQNYIISTAYPFCYAVERYFEGYEYKALTCFHFTFTKLHKYRLFQPLLRDKERHNS